MKQKNYFNVFYVVLNFFSLIWYICFATYFPKMNNKYLKIIHISLFLLLIFSRIYKYRKKIKIENEDVEVLLDIINTIFVSLNIVSIFIALTSIFSSEYSAYTKIILTPLISFFVMFYAFHKVIKYIFKITYRRLLIIMIIIILFGWFSLDDVSLIALLALVLNSLLSIEDRKKIIMFLKKKEIGNEWILNINNNNELDDDELEGKFLTQKILIYLFIIIVYLIIKFTETNNLILTIYSYVLKYKIDKISYLEKLLYKGLDRIMITLIFIIFVYSDKIWRTIINKIIK